MGFSRIPPLFFKHQSLSWRKLGSGPPRGDVDGRLNHNMCAECRIKSPNSLLDPVTVEHHNPFHEYLEEGQYQTRHGCQCSDHSIINAPPSHKFGAPIVGRFDVENLPHPEAAAWPSRDARQPFIAESITKSPADPNTILAPGRPLRVRFLAGRYWSIRGQNRKHTAGHWPGKGRWVLSDGSFGEKPPTLGLCVCGSVWLERYTAFRPCMLACARLLVFQRGTRYLEIRRPTSSPAPGGRSGRNSETCNETRIDSGHFSVLNSPGNGHRE